MDILLNDIEARVLGALIEKEITTPEYYPQSLNALINSCNQKSNREPVMKLDEGAVRQALYGLEEQGLAGASRTSDSRVTKYEHRMGEAFNFNRPETAILCVLMLRGAQTPGELRGRTERLHRFDDLSEVDSTLHRLMKREPPLVKMLPRRPGTKESRYMHLLSGDVEIQDYSEISEASRASGDLETNRIALLEEEVASLKEEIDTLKQRFLEFQKRFP